MQEERFLLADRFPLDETGQKAGRYHAPFSPEFLADHRYRKNDEINVTEVFLVDENGEKIGKTPTEKALAMAEKKELDLVEVAANARPPVCRLMDFGNFLFEQKKKDKAQRKAGKAIAMKGVRFGIRISAHDFEVKLKSARKFLEKGHPVRALLLFRGREIVHEELGHQKMKEFAAALEDIAKVEQTAKKQGRQITMLLAPQKNPSKKKTDEDDE